MRSVPPRGSGWAVSLPISNFQLSIGLFGKEPIGNPHLAIVTGMTHPLPQGGTDLIVTEAHLPSYDKLKEALNKSVSDPAFYYSRFTIYYLPKRAPVAQLDRVPDYESGGRMFESCRVHQIAIIH